MKISCKEAVYHIVSLNVLNDVATDKHYKFFVNTSIKSIAKAIRAIKKNSKMSRWQDL